ncbi:Pimeloyl-ACP methyl ester carboxylesterase [Enhydrobacter aerosaccus]|uniref:Pimeloyl-ACP methyl ester carboxylesterase n=1 Tax=Enhydrobacter aerosaccus TaxID=225324 RepID=A0A1T4TI05_9HYPH|nr:alpha/beta hydrolase [Enhydrobacter aerosaccus]SKA40083.1 Pimeloyl-ACP methyl ester carboxylesterase [Enhydrobacter aerosaccus]
MRDLVLLPGFMCDATLWADMVPDLEKLGRLHYGNVYQDDTLEGMARRVLAEVPEHFVLIGFSMGGFVARVLTLAAPERVRAVAFVASSARAYTREETEQRKQGYLPGNRPPRANGVAMGLHPDRERDPVLLGRLRDMQRRLGPEVRARQAALVRNDGYADLERITCPALVVACRQDRLRTFAETERMAQHLPYAHFEVIEDCGHMAPLERPHELAALLRRWIEREGL